MMVLYQIARILNTGGPLSNCMMEVLRALQDLASMNRGMISLLNASGDKLTVDVAYGIPDYLRQKGKYRLGEGITGQVAKTGQAVIISRLENEPAFLDRTGARKNLKLSDLAFLCVPIKISDKVIGVLSVDRVVLDQDVTLENELHFLEAVSNLISQVVEQRRRQTEQISALENENKELRQILENRGRPDQMIGNSNSMREVYRYIAQVAPSTTTVLIRGETGTGKELVARAIHRKALF